MTGKPLTCGHTELTRNKARLDGLLYDILPRYVWPEAHLPSRRTISTSPSPVKLIAMLCVFRILRVRISVREKTNTSNSADASHAAARSVKQTSHQEPQNHTAQRMMGVRMALFRGDTFDEEKNGRSVRSHHDEGRTCSLTRSHCSQLHRV